MPKCIQCGNRWNIWSYDFRKKTCPDCSMAIALFGDIVDSFPCYISGNISTGLEETLAMGTGFVRGLFRMARIKVANGKLLFCFLSEQGDIIKLGEVDFQPGDTFFTKELKIQTILVHAFIRSLLSALSIFMGIILTLFILAAIMGQMEGFFSELYWIIGISSGIGLALGILMVLIPDLIRFSRGLWQVNIQTYKGKVVTFILKPHQISRARSLMTRSGITDRSV